jgi:formate dehydrogenase subunit gamma
LVTGFALSYPSLFWLTMLVGGGPAARALHPWIGIVFTAGAICMLWVWGRDMRWREEDGAWMRAMRAYVRHDKSQVPDSGKYNGGQKMYFWLSMVFALLYLVTGLPLWFPAIAGATWLGWMRLLHYAVALGGGGMLVVHGYLATVAFPGTARAMLYGTVTRAWARLHHPLWARQRIGE